MHSQQASEGRALAMGPKRDGPNWIMIAGGAIVMAVGIVIGRKQIQCQGEQSRSRPSKDGKAELSTLIGTKLVNPLPALHGYPVSPPGLTFDAEGICTTLADSRVPSSKGTPGAHGVAYDSDSPGMKELFDDNFSADGTSSQLSWKAPRATTYWGDSGTPVSSQPQFELYSSKSKRSNPTSLSQPSSKQCRQFKGDPSSRDEIQLDSYSSPALRAGLAARREMVQKLRKQLRSREGIIFDLQAQVSDQDHAITMHRAHSADLQDRLATTNTELFKANHEIQRLRKELRIPSGKLAVNIDNRKANDNSEDRKHSTNFELKAITLEARMLNDKVKRLQGEKQEMESEVQAFSRECELLFKKASALEAERVQLKKLVNEKGHMLEAKERECIKLTTTLANLQDNLDIETRDSDWTKSSKISRPSDAVSENSRGNWSDGFDQPVSCNTPDDYYSRSANIGDGDQCAGDLMRSYNTLFRQSPSRLDSDGSVSKPGSRSTAHGCTSKSARDGSPNYDGPDFDNDENLTLSLVWSLQQEVYELSDALASRSKSVSQRKFETSRVLTEFQITQTPSLFGPEEYDWQDLSQVLSFSHDGTSAEQLQELSHKLEKVAKQQQVEDEIEALCKHQDQIRALKTRLTKLTAKCNAEIKKDQPSNESAHQMAGMILDLAHKLDVQEDQLRETSLDIQQLSMSLQLSSPYVPRSKKQELQRMLQEGSPVFGRALHKDILISPDPPSAKSCYDAVEQKPDGRSSRSFDRQISFSSLPNKPDAMTESPEKPPNEFYEFQLGAFDPLPSSKTRKSGNLGAGKSSLRKSSVYQSTGIGLKWDTRIEKPSVQPRTHRVCFSPEEVTSGFSFCPVSTKAVENPDDDRDAGVAGDTTFGHSGRVMHSDFFQSRQETEEATDRETSTGVGNHYADTYSYSQSVSSTHSQPTPSSHAHIGGSSEITPTSDDKLSSAVRIGSPTVSGSAPACFESRDNLRRFLFKPDNSSQVGNSTFTGGDSSEVVTFELEKPSVTIEGKCGFVTDDENSDVQIKRPTEKDSPSVLVTSSNSTRTNQDMHSGSGFVGVSPFAARMACLDVKRSTSSFTSSQGCEAGNQGVSLISEADDDQGSSHIESKVVVGKENIRTNELFYSGNQSVSRMISSKDNWDESQSMVAKDIFRCDRRRWNSFKDSQR
ncbi:hypothetical protein M758_8G113400 [Ceratodon purpureus]|nr:hypothetical protein M758_8G113400 [Ceratodon purpureus]